jgi:fatty acid desaturase
MKGYRGNPLAQLQRRAMGALLLIALAPLLLLIAIQALGLVAAALWQVTKPVMPYVVVFVILWAVYRTVLRVRRR